MDEQAVQGGIRRQTNLANMRKKCMFLFLTLQYSYLSGKGFGFENEAAYQNCKIHFLDIHNIHAVRESLQKVRDLSFPAIDEVNWLTNLDNTQWLRHIRSIILGANETVRYLNAGCAVVSHCSDGWDRTSQVRGWLESNGTVFQVWFYCGGEGGFIYIYIPFIVHICIRERERERERLQKWIFLAS